PHIFIMTGGGPGVATEATNYYAYLQGFSYTLVGFSSAITVVLLAATFALSLGLMRLVGRVADVEVGATDARMVALRARCWMPAAVRALPGAVAGAVLASHRARELPDAAALARRADAAELRCALAEQVPAGVREQRGDRNLHYRAVAPARSAGRLRAVARR